LLPETLHFKVGERRCPTDHQEPCDGLGPDQQAELPEGNDFAEAQSSVGFHGKSNVIAEAKFSQLLQKFRTSKVAERIARSGKQENLREMAAHRSQDGHRDAHAAEQHPQAGQPEVQAPHDLIMDDSAQKDEGNGCWYGSGWMDWSPRLSFCRLSHPGNDA